MKLKTVGRVLGGWDMILGILTYVAVSVFAGQPFSVFFLLMTIGAAHGPDFDFGPYLLLKSRMKVKSHWIIGHHPVLLIPCAELLGWYVSEFMYLGTGMYGLALMGIAITLHFAHDSVNEQGLHWLSPFTWTHLSLQGGPHLVSRERAKEIIQKLADARKRDNLGEAESRIPQLTQFEVGFLASLLVILVVFAVTTSS